MYSYLFSLLATVLVVFGTSVWSLAGVNAATLIQPKQIHPDENNVTTVTLAVRHKRLSIPLEDNNTLYYTARLYSEETDPNNSSGPLFPGPTINIVPGGRLNLTLKNQLGPDTEMPEKMDSFHQLNTTNIHYHGLYSDPHIDDIFKVASPGQQMTYDLPILADENVGLFWYHAHSHGAAYLQVMGGLFGALSTGIPQQFAHMPSQILMIQEYRLGATTFTMAYCDKKADTKMPANATILTENGTSLALPSNYFLMNGQRLPTVEINRHTQTVLRFLSAAPAKTVNVTLPSECSYELYAIDGKTLKTTRTLPSFICFQNGARYEVVATCNTTGTFTASISGDDFFYIKVSDDSSSLPQTIERSAGHHVHNNRRQQQQVAFPVTFAQSARYSKANLVTNSNSFQHEISFSQKDVAVVNSEFLIGSGSDCSSLTNDSTCFYEPFQGSHGTDMDAYHGFTPGFDQVVLLRIRGDPTDSDPHPFHLHTNHFEIVAFAPRQGGEQAGVSLADYSYQIGDIVDTFVIMDGVTTVRWRTGPFQNAEIVYHCHVLNHEDLGMMNSYYVPSA